MGHLNSGILCKHGCFEQDIFDMDQICSCRFSIGSNFKDILVQTECLHECFGWDQVATVLTVHDTDSVWNVSHLLLSLQYILQIQDK